MKLTLTSRKPSSKPSRKESIYVRMHGVKYASTDPVCPRGTARTIGTSALLNATCWNPISRANAPIARSCSSNVYECKSTTDIDVIPSSKSARNRGRSDSTSKGFNISTVSPVEPTTLAPRARSPAPKTRTRSSTSTTRSYNAPGRSIARSNISGLA